MITRRRPKSHGRILPSGRKIRINSQVKGPKKIKKKKVKRRQPSFFIIHR